MLNLFCQTTLNVITVKTPLYRLIYWNATKKMRLTFFRVISSSFFPIKRRQRLNDYDQPIKLWAFGIMAHCMYNKVLVSESKLIHVN